MRVVVEGGMRAQDFEFKIRPTIKLNNALAENLAKPECREHLPIQTQNFTENQNQNHAHVDPRLLHVRPDALEQAVRPA